MSNWLPNTQDFDYNAQTSALVFVAPAQARDILYVYPQYPLPANAAAHQNRPPANLGRPVGSRGGAQAHAGRGDGSHKHGGWPRFRRLAAAPTADSAATPAPPPAASAARANAAVNTSDYQFEEDEPTPAGGSASAPTAAKRRRHLTPTAASAAAAAVSAKPRLPTPAVWPVSLRHPLHGRQRVDRPVRRTRCWDWACNSKRSLTDVLENQRIDASLFGLFDLRTSNIKAWPTPTSPSATTGVFRTRSRPTSSRATSTTSTYRYGRHEIAPTISYPLTHNLSVRGGPRFMNISRTQLGNASTDQDQSFDYAGLNGELVFDNTLITGVNMMHGTRMKISAMSLRNLTSKDLSYGKFVIDLRHYQKISRSLVWANRASYGQFFGPRAQVFRLGGMDDWLNAGYAGPRFLTNYSDVDQVFGQEFVTNLRGFDYSARSGPRYVLFNSELRFPIVQYFARRPIYSGFFRNLQLTGFADAGTAYSGTNPFSTDNSANTRKQEYSDYFSATVVNFQNPFLIGYGAGIRTTLLGFYGKADVAWGQENYVTSSPHYYFTLGYDF